MFPAGVGNYGRCLGAIAHGFKLFSPKNDIPSGSYCVAHTLTFRCRVVSYSCSTSLAAVPLLYGKISLRNP